MKYILKIFLACFLFLSQSLFSFDSFEHFVMSEKIKLFYPDDFKKPAVLYPYKEEVIGLNKLFDKDLESEKIAEENMNNNMLKIGKNNSIQISFGEIVAIAGDYIALNKTDDNNNIFNRIISIRCDIKNKTCYDNIKKRFKKAVGYFLNYDKNPFNVFPKINSKNNDFLSMIKYIREKILRPELLNLSNTLKALGKEDLHLAYLNKGQALRTMWDNGISFGKYAGTSEHYKQILGENIDHFELDAIIAYKMGHNLALENAFKAGNNYKIDAQKSFDLINKAYVFEAFAFHFLTDLFSAGHIRTPRRAIFEDVSNNLSPTIKGIIANAMHDEDGYFGLSVINKIGDRWIAYGDESYFAKKSFENRSQINLALTNSIEDIRDAFNAGVKNNIKLNDYLSNNLDTLKSLNFVPRVFGESLEDLSKSFTIRDVNTRPLVDISGKLIRNPRLIHSADYQPLSTYKTLLSWTTSNPDKISPYSNYLLSDNIIYEIENNRLNKYDNLSLYCYDKNNYKSKNVLVNAYFVPKEKAKTSALIDLKDDESFYAVDKKEAQKILNLCKEINPKTYDIKAKYSIFEYQDYSIGIFDKYGTIFKLKNDDELIEWLKE